MNRYASYLNENICTELGKIKAYTHNTPAGFTLNDFEPSPNFWLTSIYIVSIDTQVKQVQLKRYCSRTVHQEHNQYSTLVQT